MVGLLFQPDRVRIRPPALIGGRFQPVIAVFRRVYRERLASGVVRGIEHDLFGLGACGYVAPQHPDACEVPEFGCAVPSDLHLRAGLSRYFDRAANRCVAYLEFDCRAVGKEALPVPQRIQDIAVGQRAHVAAGPDLSERAGE